MAEPVSTTEVERRKKRYVSEAYASYALACQARREIPTSFDAFSLGVDAGMAWQSTQDVPLEREIVFNDRAIEDSFDDYKGERREGDPFWEAARRAWCARAYRDEHKVVALREKIERLRKVLEIYASGTSWSNERNDEGIVWSRWTRHDGGGNRLAAQVLKETS